MQTPDGKALAFEVFHNGLLASRHRMERYLGRVTLLRATDCPEAEAWSWSSELCTDMSVLELPGRHSQLFDPKYLPTTAAAITEALSRAEVAE